jgi:choline dehydrogenase-like flavoprotein
MPDNHFDAVIVGSGVAGALIAKQLGTAGKKVLILEAGRSIPTNLNDYMKRFYTASAKVPESPYPPGFFGSDGKLVDPALLNAGRPTSLMLGDPTNPKTSYLVQKGPLPFGSTYERVGGGTSLHWLGTSLRLLPSDFKMSKFNPRFPDWPIGYDDLDKGGKDSWYAKAESELGVSADAEDQRYLGIKLENYDYPMPAIPLSFLDKVIQRKINGLSLYDTALKVTSTPAARNSQPRGQRRACAGNTNCIPICPIQAKYDPTITINEALRTGNVEIRYQSVARDVIIDGNGRVKQINYLTYESDRGPHDSDPTEVTATVFVIAANAIETPKLLLMSKNGGRTPNGVANDGNLMVGKNLMDHPYYVTWGLMRDDKDRVYPYRGPLSTAGIEDLRDYKLRGQQGAFRIEIGNEGWNFVVAGGAKGADPDVTTVDFVNGLNFSGLNPDKSALFGNALTARLNDLITRQFRLGFLIEQSPDPNNRVVLSSQFKDHLGLPRPEIHYNLSDYTKKGIAAAKAASDKIFERLNAQPFTTPPNPHDSNSFEWPPGSKSRLNFLGAGHIMGTYRMGTARNNSVVNDKQQCWNHKNLYLVGSGVFPTVGTANPTLTIAALSLWAADTILNTDLK